MAVDEFGRVYPEWAHSVELRKLLGQLERGLSHRLKQREQWLRERKYTRRVRKVRRVGLEKWKRSLD